MEMLARLLVALVALEHIGFLVLEMALWTTPRVRRSFGTTEQFARESRALAANQGLYNGFLAAGLIWGLVQPDRNFGFQLQLFFLGCVIVAGVFGALTAKRSILYVQAVPAAIALVLVWLA
ncbi:MAG TPA: DUF1304 domain-containing protein [Devosiaceae bacterium]|jgi:putative membrane protein